MHRSLRFALVLTGLCAASTLSFAAKPEPKPRALHVEVSGRGRPMLFLPGLATPGEVWRDAAAQFSDRYECHVFTLAGFGGTPRFEGPFLATMRDSLLGYVRARKLDRPVIVGHSLGGVLALQLATAAPDRIGPVVVLDALPFLGGAGRPDATAESAAKAMEPMRRMIRGQSHESYAAFQRQSPFLRGMAGSPENVARIVEWAAQSDRVTVADAMYEVNVTDLRNVLPRLRSELLVIGSWYGFKDFSTRDAVEATFRAQYAKAPRWRFAMADTARHFLMLDDPEGTWSEVSTFLASADSSAAAVRGAP